MKKVRKQDLEELILLYYQFFIEEIPDYEFERTITVRGCPEIGAQETKNPTLIELDFLFLGLLFQDTLFCYGLS